MWIFYFLIWLVSKNLHGGEYFVSIRWNHLIHLVIFQAKIWIISLWKNHPQWRWQHELPGITLLDCKNATKTSPLLIFIQSHRAPSTLMLFVHRLLMQKCKSCHNFPQICFPSMFSCKQVFSIVHFQVLLQVQPCHFNLFTNINVKQFKNQMIWFEMPLFWC